MLKYLRHGNIVRVTQGRDRFVVIINSVPKHVIETGIKEGKINVSTQYDNHLSSVLQRKYLQQVDLPLKNIEIGFVTVDEYREIEKHIFKPEISAEVRAYFEGQKENNVKLIKRVLKGEGNNAIKQSMMKRPAEVVEFNPKVLTIEYENEMNRKEIQQRARRQLILKKAREQKKDPIEQYKLKQKMERMKKARAERRVTNPNMFK